MIKCVNYSTFRSLMKKTLCIKIIFISIIFYGAKIYPQQGIDSEARVLPHEKLNTIVNYSFINYLINYNIFLCSILQFKCTL
jgi:hypothetical protein